MNRITDQRLEEILRKHKLLSEEQLVECREALEESDTKTSLYDLILRKKLVNPKTLERACRHVTVKERDLFEYQWLEQKSGGKSLTDIIAEKQAVDSGGRSVAPHPELEKEENVFLKVAVYNKLLTPEAVNRITGKSLETGDRVWYAAVQEKDMPVRAANAILEKLEEKFGRSYSDRVYTEDGFSSEKDKEHFREETQRIMKDSWLWKSE